MGITKQGSNAIVKQVILNHHFYLMAFLLSLVLIFAVELILFVSDCAYDTKTG